MIKLIAHDNTNNRARRTPKDGAGYFINHTKIIIYPLVLTPLNVCAEVSDKMPTQSGLWITGLVGGTVAALLLRSSKRLNILAVPLVLLFFYFAYDTLAQPDIGPAIIKEQGTPYVMALYGSAVLVLMGIIVGNVLNKMKRKNT